MDLKEAIELFNREHDKNTQLQNELDELAKKHNELIERLSKSL